MQPDMHALETSTTCLETRLRLNKDARLDLVDWLFQRLHVAPGDIVLDVGCGTGNQTIPFLKAVGPTGHVCATDISASSVDILRQHAGGAGNLTTQVGDMVDLRQMCDGPFGGRRYDLAHSSYAAYYASDQRRVLDAMRDSLKPHGRLAIFSPGRPHEMVEFIRGFTPIPESVDDSLDFGLTVVLPYLRKAFWEVEVHFFQNVLYLDAVEEFVDFYRATTYYNETVERSVIDEATRRLAANGRLTFEKSGSLLIASGRRDA